MVFAILFTLNINARIVELLLRFLATTVFLDRLPLARNSFAHDNPHPTLACLFNLPTLLIAFDHKMLYIATHSLQIVNRIVSQLLTTHATLSTHPGVFSSVSFLALPSSHSSFSPNHTCLFASLLIGFCSGFAFACAVCFSNLVFLTFFSFGGVFG